MTLIARAAALVAICLMTGAAHAGRPLQTEDAGVLERGESEIEAFAARSRADLAPDQRMASVQFAHGVGASTQLALQYARSRAGDERLDQLNFNGKLALVELAETRPGVALAWSIAGARPRGGDYKWQGVEVRMVGSAPLGDWTAHANVGHARDRTASQSTTLWALAVEHRTAPGLDLMIETFGDDRDRDPWINVGVRFAVAADRLFLDLSFGRQTGASGARLFTFGAKYAW